MARYGKVVGGHIADNALRVNTEGKNALIMEVVHVGPTSGVVTLYNRLATAYGGSPTDVTTGAAILAHISHALHISAQPLLVTGALTTTTAIRPIAVKLINGPTTVAVLYAYGTPEAGGSGLSICVFGKAI
jgi:hypothetical protein